MAYNLSWDEDGDRLYETGVDHVVLYPMVKDAETGKYVYGDGVAWNGVTGITESPEGAEANDIYADNMKYLSLISKENWKGTIKAYTYPDEFNRCQGMIPYNALNAFRGYFGQQVRTKFALCWRSLWGNDTVGDSFGYKIHLAYGLTAAPSEMEHATVNDSPEATEFSWEISSVPPTVDEEIKQGTSATTKLDPVSHITILHTCSKIDDILDYLYGTDGGSGVDPTTAKILTPDDLIKFIEGRLS